MEVHGGSIRKVKTVKNQSRFSRWPAWLLVALMLGTAALAAPKLLFESIKDYTAPEFFPRPYHTQLRTLVKGATAEPAGPGRVLLKQVRVERFLENGQRELLIEAPECLYHMDSKEITSAGPISAQSGDDRYKLSGVGFLFVYRGTNSSLIISNNVQTTIIGLGRDTLKP